MTIAERKTVVIHSKQYFIIRYAWKNVERMLIIDQALITEGKGKGKWSVR